MDPEVQPMAGLRHLIRLAAAPLLMAVALAAQVPVSNPGFEAGLKDWRRGAGDAAMERDGSHRGNPVSGDPSRRWFLRRR